VVDAQGVLTGLHDGVAVAQHAGGLDPISCCADHNIVSTYRCADLDVEFAHWRPVVHGVEGRDLVHTHGGHLKEARNLIHDTDAGEAVLALAEVEQRHNGGLFVLRGVAGDNLLDEFLILRREFEGNRGIVLGRIAVLQAVSAEPLGGQAAQKGSRTTMSESLRAGRETLKARH
jgi:hypothetical protein